jgi:hypothetical protein
MVLRSRASISLHGRTDAWLLSTLHRQGTYLGHAIANANSVT